MFNLDPEKLLIVGVVAVIVLGPDKLPQVARQIGGAWRTFNEFRLRMESEVRSNVPDLPSTADMARLARSPSALLDHISNLATDPEIVEERIIEEAVDPARPTPGPRRPRPTPVVVSGDASLN